jgi:uncharacterized protein (TIGR03437 family)
VNPSARFTPTIQSPHSVAVNSRGEVWVASATSNAVFQYPIYETWSLNPQAVSSIQAVVPFAVALDASDNPIVAEALNRVSIYYEQSKLQNAASFSQRGAAPGELTYISRVSGNSFASAPAFAGGLPWPTTLGDVQVLFNGTAAPIYALQANFVAFQVPSSAPVGQLSDVQLVRASTGEVLSAGTFKINSADPAFFLINGGAQIAATNEDGTVNSPNNPVGRGHVIAMYGTGAGLVSNQPPDGQIASGPVATSDRPQVLFNPGPPTAIPDANIQYFGLSFAPGVFQLNVLIPDTVPPSTNVKVVLIFKDYNSVQGPNGNLTTTIAVK